MCSYTNTWYLVKKNGVTLIRLKMALNEEAETKKMLIITEISKKFWDIFG